MMLDDRIDHLVGDMTPLAGTIINKYYRGEKLGNHHKKRVRVNYHSFVVTENR